MLEKRISRSICDQLRRDFDGWWIKVHGGPFQALGIPDIIGLVEGKFFALEVKLPGKRATKVQLHILQKIQSAGGHTKVVTSVEEATTFVRARVRGRPRRRGSSPYAARSSSPGM